MRSGDGDDGRGEQSRRTDQWRGRLDGGWHARSHVIEPPIQKQPRLPCTTLINLAFFGQLRVQGVHDASIDACTISQEMYQSWRNILTVTVTYKNAPLVELIVELRWGPGAVVGPLGLQQFSFGIPAAKDEEFYMHFAGLMFEKGYGRFERLVSPPMIAVASQAACRFRPTDPSVASPLFQVGQNVFTANALPPYKSWLDFAPALRIGVVALVEALKRAGVPPPQFTVQVVRYINAFRDNLTGGRSVQTFAKDVLGLALKLPLALTMLTAISKKFPSELSTISLS